MRAERRHRSARAVLRAATVALMMRPSVDVPSKERGLVAARGPENASLQEAPKFATYGVQINRTKQFCTGCDVVRDALQTVPLGRSAECALRIPLWRTGGVPCGTEVMSPPYARSTWSSTSL